MGGHTEGTVEGKFCTQRKDKCDLHGQEYKKNCKPKGWETESFWQGSAYVDGSNTTQEVGFEAHHVLPIATVTEWIGISKVKGIIKHTDWCINRTVNMYAMPKWGHVIKYYCTIERDDFFEADTPYFKRRDLKEPAFKNIPLHDYDHIKYSEEVMEELKKIANQIRNSKKKHKDKTKDLKKKLNGLAKDVKGELQTRGKRCGGTHKAWNKGRNKPSSDWYKPFSMASEPQKMTFPQADVDADFTRGLGKKIMERANSFLHKVVA